MQNIAADFYAQDDGSHNYPFALNAGSGTALYYRNPNTGATHVQGDQMLLPSMVYLGYQCSGSTVQFSSMAANLKTMLTSNIQRNGTTHLVTVPSGSGDVPYGFQDGIDFSTGAGSHDNLWGTALLYQAETQMAAMYTAVGDSTNAATMAADAALLKSNVTAVLWDSGAGMFNASSGVNAQIDIAGSAFACSVGLASPSQCTAISTWLSANYASIENSYVVANGYLRKSPTNWAQTYSVPSSGSGQYDNGYWVDSLGFILQTMALTDLTAAARLASDYANGPMVGIEWMQTTNAARGAVNQIHASAGVLGFMKAHPSLFQ